MFPSLNECRYLIHSSSTVIHPKASWTLSNCLGRGFMCILQLVGLQFLFSCRLSLQLFIRVLPGQNSPCTDSALFPIILHRQPTAAKTTYDARPRLYYTIASKMLAVCIRSFAIVRFDSESDVPTAIRLQVMINGDTQVRAAHFIFQKLEYQTLKAASVSSSGYWDHWPIITGRPLVSDLAK
jgi:hypothetical protein